MTGSLFRLSRWRLLLAAGCLMLMILSSGCGRPSPQDATRLDSLRARYGNLLEFEIEENLYLHARQRDSAVVPESKLKEIYDFFVFEDGDRRPTPVVYLNYYDTVGRFQYQLFYDPKIHRIRRDDRSEHY
jgi:hypothetical protein